LPSISTQANTHRRKDPATEELEKPQDDIDSQFEAMVKRALKPYVQEKSKAEGPTVEESFKVFRTRLVIIYLFSNFMLCIFVMNDSFDSLKFLVS